MTRRWQVRCCIWGLLGVLLAATPLVPQRPQVPQVPQRPREGAPASLSLFQFSHPAMGTSFELTLYADSGVHAAEISEEVFDEVDRVEQLLSNYRDTSELARINRDAAGGDVTTNPEMMRFLTEARHWSEVSDGAFDITVGRLMRSWGFYRHQGAVPPEAELAGLRAVTGWQKMDLGETARTVHFTEPGVELDPGGIGKGFAVDAAVRVLRADHVAAALLSAGSSTLYGLGAPPGREGWRVVVPGPLPSHKTLSVVLLRDESLSSADCSQKHFIAGGHLYCHIMDPRTLRPVEGRLQVSFVDPSATASDALSNVAFVLSPAQTRDTLRRAAPESEALMVSSKDGEVSCSAFRWRAAVQARCPLVKAGTEHVR